METKPSFEMFSLKKQLVKNIYAYGFEQPNEIQMKTIPHILEKRDIMAQARAGSGKTPCFTIGCLNQIKPEEKRTQALLLVPTRELAKQIYKILDCFSTNMGVKVQLFCGGERSEFNSYPPQIVIGTPGRITDLLKRKKLNISSIDMFILDEVDEMLNQGFKEQIKDTFDFVQNKDVQCVFFSATISDELVKHLKEQDVLRPDAVIIKLEDQELSVENIKNYFVQVKDKKDKTTVLVQLLNSYDLQCIVYFNSKENLQHFVEEAQLDVNYKIIHGAMAQEERNQVLEEFRKNVFPVLLATDLLSRGIDIQTMKLVINYDFPRDKTKYIHRVGRCGRYSREGIAVSIITDQDIPYIKEVQQTYNCIIREMEQINQD